MYRNEMIFYNDLAIVVSIGFISSINAIKATPFIHVISKQKELHILQFTTGIINQQFK